MNTKAASERYQRQVLELVKQPGNDMCADCCGRAPRWASWNLGIFVCVQCAGIHRKMGTHISKIKSLTLDTWTRDHVERMKEMGNIKSNEKWNPDERRNRPPANIDEGERNSELEKFIFDKYKGKFMDKKPPPVPQKDASSSSLRLSPSPNPVRSYGAADGQVRRRMPESLRDSDPITRSKTAPIPASWAEARARAASASPALSAPKLPDRETTTAASSTFPVPAFAYATSAASVGVSSPSSHDSEAAFAKATGPPRASSSLQVPSLSSANHSQGSETAYSSSVFDELLQLQQGSAPIPHPSFHTNPWAEFQATNQPVQLPGHFQISQQSRQPQVYFSPQSTQSGSQNGFANSTHCQSPFSGPALSLGQHHHPGYGNDSMVANVATMQHHVPNANPGTTALMFQEASVNPMQNNPFSQHQQPIFRSEPPQSTEQGGRMQPPMTAFANMQQQQQQQQQDRMMMGQQAFSPGFHTYSPRQQQGNSQSRSYFG